MLPQINDDVGVWYRLGFNHEATDRADCYQEHSVLY